MLQRTHPLSGSDRGQRRPNLHAPVPGNVIRPEFGGEPSTLTAQGRPPAGLHFQTGRVHNPFVESCVADRESSERSQTESNGANEIRQIVH
jgi:hypothetical protein